MAIVTGDRYLDNLVKFVEKEAGPLLEGALILKLNPVGLHYVQSRLEQLQELEGLLAGAPVDYLRAYISDLGDHRALEQLRRILRLLTSLKVVSIFPPPARDPTPLSLLPFDRLRVLELRGCDLSTSAARGLLELRHTLEKISCYNSTDALRHIFASRIVNIKDSPVWNKLTFVSCACNELVPMDESLQLLPAVEIMDLSRNRFAKVDNLRKCTKLKHLDLGFNHLRTIASLSEVLCPIVKLVLRNNALTTLRGIENLKSVEGLDLSYNIISNFSELELLAGLSSLENLWLEGNPICCARWYRAHVFSIFTLPDKLKLDERGISRREFWKRQIILASRQKRPAGQGFYSPAKAEDDGGSSFSAKRKKLSRLACIYDDEQRRYFGSDSVEESVSCDSEKFKRDENAISDSEEDLLGLMNRVEFAKKERSVLWLREFREWMDQTSEMDKKFTGPTLSPSEGKYTKRRKSRKHLGESSKHILDSIHDSGDETSTNAIESESSKHVLDSIQDSGDETSTNAIESEIQFTDVYSGFHAHDSSISSKTDGVRPSIGNGNHEARRQKEQLGSSQEDSFFLNTSNTVGGKRTNPTISTPSLTAIDELMGSRASSMHLGSPPHYEEDILHRRHDLEEEFMQLSAESYSMASSDTDTSCCDDDSSKMSGSGPRFDNLSDEESIDENLGYHHDALFPDNFYDSGCEEPSIRRNTRYLLNSSSEPYSDPDYEMLVDTDDVKMNKCMSEEVGFLEERTKRVLKKRVISLSEETFTTGKKQSAPSKLNGKLEIGNACNEDGKRGEDLCEFDILQSQSVGYKLTMGTEVDRLLMCGAGNCSLRTHEFIKDYFNNKIADSRVSEACLQCVRCRCILQGSDSRQKEVAVLLSSVNKVYILVIDAKDRGPGDLSKVLGCYRLKDTKDILIGIGLQVLSVQFVRDAPFLFVTRTIEISRALLSLLRVCDASETNHKCSLRSWEQVQAELFEKSICSGLKVSIFLYSMVLFWHKSGEGESWFSRSLFVIEEYVLVCVEDLVKFGSVTDNDLITSPYFILDSCCSIRNISEMVIDTRESRCLTLTMDRDVPQNIHFLAKLEKGKQPEEGSVAPLTWRLKWFSEDTLLKFVALLKAIHAGISMSPLPVRCAS